MVMLMNRSLNEWNISEDIIYQDGRVQWTAIRRETFGLRRDIEIIDHHRYVYVDILAAFSLYIYIYINFIESDI